MPTRRTFLTVGAITVGAAAVGVPAYLWLRDDGEPGPGDGNLWAPMLYRATWLPDGLVAAHREGSASGKPYQERSWMPADWMQAQLTGNLEDFAKLPKVLLSVDPGPLDRPANDTLDGKPAARAEEGPQGTSLTWAEGDRRISVTVVGPGHADDVRRVAGSVVPDTTAGVEAGLAFGWLPDRAAREPLTVMAAGSGKYCGSPRS